MGLTRPFPMSCECKCGRRSPLSTAKNRLRVSKRPDTCPRRVLRGEQSEIRISVAMTLLFPFYLTLRDDWYQRLLFAVLLSMYF